MERKKASDFPQALLNLFDRYVHGEIHRREFIDGAQKFAVGGVTATALFEMLRPNYAWAIQVPESDTRIKVEPATIPSPKGNGTITGYMAREIVRRERLEAALIEPLREERAASPQAPARLGMSVVVAAFIIGLLTGAAGLFAAAWLTTP